MMGRKKRILIIILSIILGILLIVGGILLYLNLTTDLLKSNDEIFYKYMYKNADIANVFDTNLLDRYFQKIDNNKYISNGQLTIKTGLSDSSQNDTEQFDNLINNLKIKYTSKSNLSEKKKSTDLEVLYNNEKQFNVNAIQSDNKYGVKSDEVVYKYLVLKNEKLSDVYSKLGLENVNKIPSQFSRIDYNIIKNMNEEDKNNILTTYQNLLKSQITLNHFSVKKNVSVTMNGQTVSANAYALVMTEQEIVSLKLKLLEKLQTDEITLKYLTQFLQLDSSYTVQIKQNIQEEIDKLKKEEFKEDEKVSITLYVKDKKLLATKIENNESTYTITNEKSEKQQTVKILGISNDGNKVTSDYILERNSQDNKNTFKFEKTDKAGETVTGKNSVEIELDGNIESSDKLNIKAQINNQDSNKINIINYESEKQFSDDVQPDELSDEDAIIVNDMNVEDTKSLNSSVKDRLKYLYETKLTNLGYNVETVNYQATLKVSRIIDAFDEDEFRTQVQRALNLAKDDIQNKEEYKNLLVEAGDDANKIKQIKGLITVSRLKETGLDATLNEEDNSILIKTNSETAHKYEIDYENFKISKIE